MRRVGARRVERSRPGAARAVSVARADADISRRREVARELRPLRLRPVVQGAQRERAPDRRERAQIAREPRRTGARRGPRYIRGRRSVRVQPHA